MSFIIPRFEDVDVSLFSFGDGRSLAEALAEQFVPTDEGEMAVELHKHGYPDVWVAAIIKSVQAEWRKTECATCGQQATHMWASLSEEGVPTSMNGAWTFTPSCDECSGNSFDDGAGRPVIRAPIDTPTAIPRPPGEYIIGPEIEGYRAELALIKAALDEFDAETLDQLGLDRQMSRPLVDRVADHIAYTISLQRKLVAAKEAVR